MNLGELITWIDLPALKCILLYGYDTLEQAQDNSFDDDPVDTKCYLISYRTSELMISNQKVDVPSEVEYKNTQLVYH